MLVGIIVPIKHVQVRRFETFEDRAPPYIVRERMGIHQYTFSGGLTSCWRCLMFWTSSSNIQLCLFNSSMVVCISTMASTSPVPLVLSGVSDKALMFTMANNS